MKGVVFIYKQYNWISGEVSMDIVLPEMNKKSIYQCEGLALSCSTYWTI